MRPLLRSAILANGRFLIQMFVPAAKPEIAVGGPSMHSALIPSLVSILPIAGCAGGPGSRAVAERAGSDLLKLRAGPGLSYRIILGLPDGTALTRHHSVTEVSQLWCRVSLRDAPGVTGYVSADYLSGS
jgi:hypothetical protein